MTSYANIHEVLAEIKKTRAIVWKHEARSRQAVKTLAEYHKIQAG